MLETKKVLITVKAYPNPSKKYKETVCCAGIDLESNEWIRLYPIPFRDLDKSQQFEKYNIVNLNCRKSSSDSRIESYHVDADSIRTIAHIGTSQNWLERRQILLPTASQSFCEILENTKHNKSLGMFKPHDISFSHKPAPARNMKMREAPYAQLTFFDNDTKMIEHIPFYFYYSFKCFNNDCPGHKLPIFDWELGQAYRKWKQSYPDEVLFDKLEEKWLNQICSPQNDIYFFVGNIKRFKKQFLVLGTFYPKKTDEQLLSF